ncbi:uncharacterized protein LOC112562429 [Pomacea canaliculata]|uniref:uncharacterized protein LOC112562429 n=1 Tax=Pomacea canaliculata TaxID=400727 RepID=UPI000D7351DB|nr:uncharacterized protein LOC112562429 [Pomacea canaliculata]
MIMDRNNRLVLIHYAECSRLSVFIGENAAKLKHHFSRICRLIYTHSPDFCPTGRPAQRVVCAIVSASGVISLVCARPQQTIAAMHECALLFLVCVVHCTQAFPVVDYYDNFVRPSFSLASCYKRTCIYTGFKCIPQSHSHQCCVGFCNETTKLCDTVKCMPQGERCDREIFDPVCCSGNPCPVQTGICE